MENMREFCGYMLGLAFCALAVILCAIAWYGLENMFGWQWAIGGILLSLVVRINVPVVVGLYYYAYNIFGWPMPESIAFALPGLLIIAPSVAMSIFGMIVMSVAMSIFGMIVGTAARR